MSRSLASIVAAAKKGVPKTPLATVVARAGGPWQGTPRVDVSQRWTAGQDRYRLSSEERFNPDNHRVVPMVNARDMPKPLRAQWPMFGKYGREVSAAFVIANHYQGSYPQHTTSVGLFEGDELVGIAAFSDLRADIARRYGGVEKQESLELSRFVLLDRVSYGAETWLLKRAFDWARAYREARTGGRLLVVVSYSDPQPRQALDGRLTMPGHVGNIYQAFNGTFVGFSASKTVSLDPQGRIPHARMLVKIRSLDRPAPAAGVKRTNQHRELGAETSADRFVDGFGAAPRRRGETAAEWVFRALRSAPFRRYRHGGNLVYLWPQGGRPTRRRVLSRAPEERAYLKTPRQRYINLYNRYKRAWAEGRLDGGVGDASELSDQILVAWEVLTPSQRATVSPPPQFGVSCAIGGGSRAVAGATLDQLMQRVIC